MVMQRSLYLQHLQFDPTKWPGVEIEDRWRPLPSLVSLSNKGPIQAEFVSMMLRWLPEDITVHNEDLEGNRQRLLLRGLNQSLPEILPLLYNLLERHFGAALSEVSRQQLDIAKQHIATVTATLNAINACAEWAPLPDLTKYGVVSYFLLLTFVFMLASFSYLSCQERDLLMPLLQNLILQCMMSFRF
ncbi:hypothetical protein QYF36_008121 [Acer negundo]|nr:hypothetical protein QYF36_008121 [Acer negundo]